MNQQPTKRKREEHSPDIEIIRTSNFAFAPDHPPTTIKQEEMLPTTATAPHSASPAAETVLQTDLIKRSFTDLFKFLILHGPQSYSNHKALQEMAKSAQTCLDDEPDETVFQAELEDKNLQLKRSEDELDAKLIQVADPIVQALSQFIQAHLVREIQKGKNHIKQKKSLEQQNPQIDSILEKIRTINVRLGKLESRLNQSTQNPNENLPPGAPPPNASVPPEGASEEIKQIRNTLRQLQNTEKSHHNQLQAKFATIEANTEQQIKTQSSRLEERLSEVESNHKNNSGHSRRPSHNNLQTNTDPSSLPNPSSKHNSPEIARTPVLNELKLALSPQTLVSQPQQPSSRPVATQQVPPSFQSKLTTHTQHPTHPSPTATHESSAINRSARPTTDSNQIGNQQRPHPLPIPSRTSVDSGRPPNQHQSTDNPSQSPVHSMSNPTTSCPTIPSQFFSRTQLEDMYNYISNRLMKSSWLQDYSKSRLSEIYKQYFYQDLASCIDSHLNQLGLSSNKITDILNLLNLLPDLDINFLKKRKHPYPPSQSQAALPSAPNSAPLPINTAANSSNNATAHSTMTTVANHSLPKPPINLSPLACNPANLPINANGSMMYIHPSAFNITDNLSLFELKEMLSTMKIFSQESHSRIDRLEIKLANVEKLGVADHGILGTLNKRMEFVEAQGTQLLSTQIGSDELFNLELRIQTAQQDSLKTLRDEVAMMIQSIPVPPVPVPPVSPATNIRQSSVGTNCLTGLTLAKVENHILNKFMNGIPSMNQAGDVNHQTTKGTELGEDQSEREEGETVDDDDDDDDDDQPGRATKSPTGDGQKVEDTLTRSMALKNKTRWNKFYDFFKVLESRWMKLEGEQPLTIDHHHHHHHQHHHQVRMALGINHDSVDSIDSLQINRSVERQVWANSQPNQSLQNNNGTFNQNNNGPSN